GMTACLALNYGGRDEITKAVQKIVSEGTSAEDITEELISSKIYTADYPDPDLIIRPSGEYRLSNFLTWQSAYSEFYFDKVLWPDFTTKDLDRAIDEFNRRNRRFGGV
ncbi:MAG: polyprenyl diphosphate synthase, partial [Acutalibacteraceae bacterium]|nr:polyprenyl diphosphate synthase [Acutalibacteraceae bacterium]